MCLRLRWLLSQKLLVLFINTYIKSIIFFSADRISTVVVNQSYSTNALLSVEIMSFITVIYESTSNISPLLRKYNPFIFFKVLYISTSSEWSIISLIPFKFRALLGWNILSSSLVKLILKNKIEFISHKASQFRNSMNFLFKIQIFQNGSLIFLLSLNW